MKNQKSSSPWPDVALAVLSGVFIVVLLLGLVNRKHSTSGIDTTYLILLLIVTTMIITLQYRKIDPLSEPKNKTGSKFSKAEYIYTTGLCLMAGIIIQTYQYSDNIRYFDGKELARTYTPFLFFSCMPWLILIYRRTLYGPELGTLGTISIYCFSYLCAFGFIYLYFLEDVSRIMHPLALRNIFFLLLVLFHPVLIIWLANKKRSAEKTTMLNG